jgi:Tfp pilus assembly ATPase PilU
MQTGARRGMQTMEQSLTELVQRGAVSVPEAVSRSSRPEALMAALERAGISISVMPTDGAANATPAIGTTLRVAGS